jgi:hypothetical protein
MGYIKVMEERLPIFITQKLEKRLLSSGVVSQIWFFIMSGGGEFECSIEAVRTSPNPTQTGLRDALTKGPVANFYNVKIFTPKSAVHIHSAVQQKFRSELSLQ